MMAFPLQYLKASLSFCARSKAAGIVFLAALCSVILGWHAPIHAQGLVGAPTTQITQITAPAKSLAVPTAVPAFYLPVTGALDPDTLWSQSYPATQPANAQGVWRAGDNQRTAAKFTISAQTDHLYTLEFPLTRLDLIDVFWRSPGKPWTHAQAGDTVALSAWPIVGQYPTFVLQVDTLPGVIDVLVTMQNAGFAQTTVVLSADRESRERRLMQANAAGLVIGASAMVLLISMLLCVLYRSTGSVCLLAYSLAVTLGSIVLNGYGAIWFTPEWPQFNDGIKPMVATLISTTMLCACMAALDKTVVNRGWRLAAVLAVVLLLAYAAAQWSLLPFSWRLGGGVAGAVVVTVIGLGLCLSSWRKGDRYAAWVALAVLMFALSAVVVARGFLMVRGVDLFSALTSVSLIASILVLRHVLVLRERYGRAVMGRAVINQYRDPLTALLSYEGFERAVDNLAVRQHSGGGVAHMLYFSLLSLDNFRHEDGYIVWQRDLVRFAAVLQKVLGNGWHIGRLSNSKFGAVRLDDHRNLSTEPLLTLVLTSCSRKIDTKDWVDRVGLRMAGVCTPLTGSGLKESLRVLDQSVRDLEAGKRIALL
jgi:two-component system, sensor histidine kinase LadS